jgi:uncharacterized protein (TIGR02300 family)
VTKPEWGTKRTCHTCGARFYDLRRDTIVCPVCGAVHDPDRQPKPRRPGPAVKEEPVLAARLADGDVVAEPMDEDSADADAGDVEMEDVDETDNEESGEDELAKEGSELMEDTSELGEDDDDIGEVMEHVDDEHDDKP